MSKVVKDSLKKDLLTVIQKWQKKEGTTFYGAFRDALTDMLHISKEKKIAFIHVLESAEEVYKQEKGGRK
jgi:hypothetical protein